MSGQNEIIKFTVLNIDEILSKIKLSENTPENTYSWKEILPTQLQLKNYEFIELSNVVEYTITVLRANGTSDSVKFSVYNKSSVLDTIKLTGDTAEYTYSWKDELPKELQYQNYTFVEEKTAVEYTITVLRTNGNSESVKFSVYNKSSILDTIKLTANNEEYIYSWQSELPQELQYQNYTFVEEKIAVEYTITVMRANGRSESVKFSVNNKSSILDTIKLTANNKEYTYSWQSELPQELQYQDYAFVEEKTAVEYSFTINRANNTVETEKFTVENIDEKFSGIKLTESTKEYTYSWVLPLPNIVELKNYIFNERKNAVNYLITIVRFNGNVETINFNVENKTEKINEIVLTQNTDAYSYYFKENIPEILQLANYVFTEKQVENIYIIMLNYSNKVTKTIEFCVSNVKEKFKEIKLTENSEEYTYCWDKVIPENPVLDNYEFTEIKVAVEYTITVNYSNGESKVITYNVENKADKLALITITADTKEYRYSFDNDNYTELKNYVVNEIKTANEYKIVINRANGEAEELTFTVLDKEEKYQKILLTENSKAYTYSWESEMPNGIELQNYTFAEARTPVEYKVTINRADESREEISFNIENKAQKILEIVLTENTAKYTYSWEKGLPSELQLENYVFTENRIINSYKVEFKNGDIVLQSDVLQYGTMPKYLGETPIKIDEHYVCTFDGWDSEITQTESDKTYNAKYVEIPNKYVVEFHVTGRDKKIGRMTLDYGTVIDLSSLNLDYDGYMTLVSIDGKGVNEIVVNGNTLVNIAYVKEATKTCTSVKLSEVLQMICFSLLSVLIIPKKKNK